MHALIVDTDPRRLDPAQIALVELGVQVTGGGPLLARACLSHALVDLLVLDLQADPDGALIDLAETRNRRLVSILLSSDVARDTERMTRAHRSVHCVLGRDVAPTLTAKLGLASLTGGPVCPAQEARPVAPPRPEITARPVFYSRRCAQAA
ncbi:hypothetical protein [Pseudoponticoccus marisrubri]|uniref:Response regulatory domain-containing protein n=1 Tax=Pseudoponticoccus marisrubri TaxID=1685382 RepID=A0A0W7WNI7_9RHOB|nr:hypothetical protein [Pseudoponticoccus marisrubri]KUF12056.1 hypothetical protein AVJ23_05645 [Pseudoponticoccus marisrubri]